MPRSPWSTIDPNLPTLLLLLRAQAQRLDRGVMMKAAAAAAPFSLLSSIPFLACLLTFLLSVSFSFPSSPSNPSIYPETPPRPCMPNHPPKPKQNKIRDDMRVGFRGPVFPPPTPTVFASNWFHSFSQNKCGTQKQMRKDRMTQEKR